MTTRIVGKRLSGQGAQGISHIEGIERVFDVSGVDCATGIRAMMGRTAHIDPDGRVHLNGEPTGQVVARDAFVEMRLGPGDQLTVREVPR